MIKLDNRSPWQTGLYSDWSATRVAQTTLVIKLGYRFDPQGRTEALDPSSAIEPVDRYYEENPAASLATARESVPFKRGGEILCQGTAHPPDPEARVMEVSLGLSREAGDDWRKTLRVCGPRHWHKGLLATHPSDPAPLQAVALRYEFAYGGRDPHNPDRLHQANPAGVGYSASSRWREGLGVPQIEIGPDYLKNLSQRPAPAGFGPIPGSWQPRAGTTPKIDEGALAVGHCPYSQDLPPDFHNAAPLDQRFEHPFQGGERLHLAGLVAGAPPSGIRIEIPRTRPAAWLVSAESPPSPVPLICDTLTVRADEREIHLLWRGAIEHGGEAEGYIVVNPGANDEPETEQPQ